MANTFYEQLGVPAPKGNILERQRHRMTFRNERVLYNRKCDKTGKDIISMYHPDSPYKVYEQEAWWSDDWDPMDYGREYDFSRAFFEQFAELQQKVPRMNLNVIGSENCNYTNYALRNRNCYLIYTADYNENCMYGRMGLKNYECLDWDFADDNKHCYEITDCYTCHSCYFCRKCEATYDSYFSLNLKGCNNCLGCVNLTQQSYQIFNEKVSEEEFKKKKEEVFSSYENMMKFKEQTEAFFLKFPRKDMEILNCENSIGDYLKNCRNAEYCFDSYDLEDCKYTSYTMGLKNCEDWDFVGVRSELCYQMVNCAYDLHECKFCMNCWEGCNNLNYCDLCLSSSDLFGCVGLRSKKQFCILNKQYTEDQYKELVPKIIEHMKSTGQWGQFFPQSCNLFAYNESIAHEHYPLSKEQATQLGYNWREKEEKQIAQSSVKIPANTENSDESLCNEVLACEQCKKAYKILKQELVFHKKTGIPFARVCPDCRHDKRMAKRNPRQIFSRKCAKCQKAIKTTYSENKPEIVYCGDCYQKEVFA